MMRMTEKQCHISLGISATSFSRALFEINHIDSTSGLDKRVL